jgi:hypothetical protein
MPGKPFQSKLKPYEFELREILASGVGYRGTSAEINRRHGLNVSHNAVFSFLKKRLAPRAERGLFYEGLPAWNAPENRSTRYERNCRCLGLVSLSCAA